MTDREYEHLLALRKCGEWKLTDLLWARYKELELKCKDSGREASDYTAEWDEICKHHDLKKRGF